MKFNCNWLIHSLALSPAQTLEQMQQR